MSARLEEVFSAHSSTDIFFAAAATSLPALSKMPFSISVLFSDSSAWNVWSRVVLRENCA